MSSRWKMNFLLFTCSFGIYFFYFSHLFLNINSVLSSITGDTIKNYYTFIYHIKNDKSVLHFSGMNFPFGEHIVYTDCQPLITFILRILPFTHNHLIGIAHGLILLSLLITPLVLNAIFLRLGVDKICSFILSLAIAILSPQIRRLDGHFALSYECVIPITILLLLKYFQDHNKHKVLVMLFLFNCSLFLIHPYIGFGTSVLSFFSILIYSLLNARNSGFLKHICFSIFIGLAPIILFKLFMKLTDLHINRTVEPDGISTLIANVASVFVPNFGPFQDILKKIISDAPQDYEGLSYVGVFTDFLIAFFIIAFPFLAKKMSFTKETTSLFISSLLLLLFSFGLHNKLFDLLHIHTTVFNQFRTLGRFAWFFYYILPVFLIPLLYHTFKTNAHKRYYNYTFRILSLLFFLFNLSEANSLLNIYSTTIFKDRNFFDSKFLNGAEKENVQNIRKNKPQAIITLPSFYVGSEVYSRTGGDPSLIPAIIYSYHTATPISGTYLSRTSISETEAGIELLNAYKRHRKVLGYLSPAPFLVINTNELLLPDEERLLKKTKIFQKNDSLKIGYVSRQDLLTPTLNKNTLTLTANQNEDEGTRHVIYLRDMDKRPYLPSKMSDYEKAYTLDSLKIPSGRYIVSLHFHYTEKTFRGVYNHLIVVKINKTESVWEYAKALRIFSGFYPGFAVFEYPIELKRDNKYEFLLNGFGDRQYHISNFMVRPDTTDVRVIYKNRDTTINNFPI